MAGSMGSLGDIIFEVYLDRILTPGTMTHTFGGRWADTDIIGQKPVSQFLGPAPRSITLPIKLTLSDGLFPEEESERIRALAEAGEVQTLIIGGAVKGHYRIESVSEAWKRIDDVGNIHCIDMNLQLKEYS